MSAHEKEAHQIDSSATSPVAIESLCLGLSHTGALHLQKIASAIEQLAPSPGQVVYLHTTELAMHVSGLQPVIFSAIDAATHLQVAQVNFALTSAAAWAFVDFVAQSFPFPMVTIKTRKSKPFHNPSEDRPNRDFPALVRERGYSHAFAKSHSTDALFSITSKMLFKELTAGQALPASAYELQSDLSQFLFYHNNFRFVPWLEGRTPIQRLREFKGFHRLHSFNPTDKTEHKVEHAARNAWNGKDFRCSNVQYDCSPDAEALSRRTP